MASKTENSQPSNPNNNEDTPKKITSRPNRILRIAAEYAGGRPFPSLNLKQTFTALTCRNYRLWFMGQLVSLVADELRGRVVSIYTLSFVVDNIPPKAHCLQVKDLIYLT